MTLLDRQIREPLFEFLEETCGRVRIMEEKQIGRSRADVMMVTETGLYGIEIKSDADSYTRLRRQVKDYDRYYDFNILAVGTRHAVHCADHIPSWWGIITVEREGNRIDCYMMRKPSLNPKVKLSDQLTLLWRPELASVQKRLNLPRYKEKSKRFVQQKLLEKTEPDELKREIRNALFERDYTLIGEEIGAFRRGEKRD